MSDLRLERAGQAGLRDEGAGGARRTTAPRRPVPAGASSVKPRRPVRPAPLRIDLGCGVAKTAGFLGVDRFPLPGVDLVCDINHRFPLADDSVDELLSSHSLEHFADLPSVAKEIYRVCKDRAIVTFIVPYQSTRLNEANPFHVQMLNEHTARFFTNAPKTLMEFAEYDFPVGGTEFGLASSDNSSWVEDFRYLKSEFFYFAAYRGLSAAAKTLLRRSISDVCDQFVLRLLVVKGPISDVELRIFAETSEFTDTDFIVQRRALEAQPGEPNAFTALAELPDRLADATVKADQAQFGLEALREVVATAVTQSSQAFAKLEPVPADVERLSMRAEGAEVGLEALREVVAGAVTQSSHAFARLEAVPAEVERLLRRADGSDDAVEALRELVATSVTQSSQAFARLAEVPAELERLRARAVGSEDAVEVLRELVATSVTQASQAFARLSEVPAELDRLRARADGSEDAVEALRDLVATSVTQSSQAFARLNDLPEAVGRLQGRADGADDSVDALRRLVAEAVTQSSQAFARLEDVPAQLDRLRLRADGGDDAVEALRRVVAEAVTQSSQAFARLHDLPETVGRLQTRADGADDAVVALREVVATAVTQSSVAFARLDQAGSDTAARLARFDGRFEEAERELGRVADARRRLDAAEAELDGAVRALRRLEPLRQTVGDLQAELQDSVRHTRRAAELSERVDILDAATRAADRTAARVDDLAPAVEALQQARAEAEQALAGLAAHPEALAELQTEAATLRADLERLAETPDALACLQSESTRAFVAIESLAADRPLLHETAGRAEFLLDESTRTLVALEDLAADRPLLHETVARTEFLLGESARTLVAVEDLAADRPLMANTAARAAALEHEAARTLEAVERVAAEMPRLAEIERLYDELNGRGQAVHIEAVRRALALEGRFDQEAAERSLLVETVQTRAAAASDAGRVEAGLQRLVRAEIARERDRPRLLRWVNQWLRRGEDRSDDLTDGPFADTVRDGEAVHLERFWRLGDSGRYPVQVEARPLAGLDVAAWALMPPAVPIHGLEFVLGSRAGATLFEGACAVEPGTGAEPLRLRFPPLTVENGEIVLRLFGTESVEAAGLKLYERRRLQPITRKVRDNALAILPVYA